jgi:hypothetical protein
MGTFPFSDMGPDLVSLFGTPRTVTRVRRGKTVIVDGFADLAVPQRQPLRAIVYPATYRDVQVLEEGKRTEETLHVITTEELRTVLEGVYYADQIEYQGRLYEVASVKDWSANANYYSVLATRVAGAMG